MNELPKRERERERREVRCFFATNFDNTGYKVVHGPSYKQGKGVQGVKETASLVRRLVPLLIPIRDQFEEEGTRGEKFSTR